MMKKRNCAIETKQQYKGSMTQRIGSWKDKKTFYKHLAKWARLITLNEKVDFCTR
jgi:hypothetical protein